jgi:phage shock protein PspC (stress-responsive transcriptional regulator)
MARRLTRNTENAFLGGVASGFADYFDIDPVIARLGFVFLAFLHGAGCILYVICWVIMPAAAPLARPPTGAPDSGSRETGGAEPEGAAGGPAPGAGTTPADRFASEVRSAGEQVVENLKGSAADPGRGQMIGGAILVGIGLLFLLPNLDLWFWPHWLDLWDLWPLIPIAIGASMLIGAARGGRT